MGALYWAAVKSKTVNENLETLLAAAGYCLFGSRSELAGYHNTLDYVRLKKAYIRQESKDSATSART